MKKHTIIAFVVLALLISYSTAVSTVSAAGKGKKPDDTARMEQKVRQDREENRERASSKIAAMAIPARITPREIFPYNREIRD